MEQQITILGAGGFGTALAVMLHQTGYDVCLWSAFPQEIEGIRLHGEHRKLLPGIAVDPQIRLCSRMDQLSMRAGGTVIWAIPSFALREVAQAVAPYLPKNTVLVNVGKGFEPVTQKRLSVVLQEEFPQQDVLVLSGPSHAEEIARGIPTTMVLADAGITPAASHERLLAVQDLLMNTDLRIYLSDDVMGVEIGGALKNIIALASGICEGMGLGDNSKAALMTRGMAEITRLGVAMGARRETFYGLSGMGDLIVTCTSAHSRNLRAGRYIGEGYSGEEALARVGMTVEGVHATRSAYHLAKQTGVEMPITSALYQVLFENASAPEAVASLMARPKCHETEII